LRATCQFRRQVYIFTILRNDLEGVSLHQFDRDEPVHQHVFDAVSGEQAKAASASYEKTKAARAEMELQLKKHLPNCILHL
jgi:hypothetical protein